jgi:hypothetical protein
MVLLPPRLQRVRVVMVLQQAVKGMMCSLILRMPLEKINKTLLKKRPSPIPRKKSLRFLPNLSSLRLLALKIQFSSNRSLLRNMESPFFLRKDPEMDSKITRIENLDRMFLSKGWIEGQITTKERR